MILGAVLGVFKTTTFNPYTLDKSNEIWYLSGTISVIPEMYIGLL